MHLVSVCMFLDGNGFYSMPLALELCLVLPFLDEIDFISRFPVWFDPTDIAKVGRLDSSASLDALSGFSPNLNEFKQFCRLFQQPAIPGGCRTRR